jgi:hypothetical protein
MNLIHNAIIRSLNAIYLQAPVVSPSDAPSFLRYCKTWSDFLHSHHLAEETHYFPYIATATGSSSVVDIHIEQHKAFEAGLRQFDKYISSLEKFSSIELRRVIDSFAPILTDHLENEIKALVNLRIFADIPGFDILSIEAQAPPGREPAKDGARGPVPARLPSVRGPDYLRLPREPPPGR